jgi:hypothetical protein
MSTELRDYQLSTTADFHAAVEAGKRRIIIVAPTGAGKTVIAAAIIKDYVARGKTVLVLAHRREIISQTSAKLFALGISHGIIQAGFSPHPLERVQVASISTLYARAVRGNKMDLPDADLLVVDEAHHSPARTYTKIIAAYPDAVLLGLTATPCRGDGRGLGGLSDLIIQTPQVAELIAAGHLVKTRVYAPVDPNLKGVKVQGGDYVESQQPSVDVVAITGPDVGAVCGAAPRGQHPRRRSWLASFLPDTNPAFGPNEQALMTLMSDLVPKIASGPTRPNNFSRHELKEILLRLKQGDTEKLIAHRFGCEIDVIREIDRASRGSA